MKQGQIISFPNTFRAQCDAVNQSPHTFFLPSFSSRFLRPHWRGFFGFSLGFLHPLTVWGSIHSKTGYSSSEAKLNWRSRASLALAILRLRQKLERRIYFPFQRNLLRLSHCTDPRRWEPECFLRGGFQQPRQPKTAAVTGKPSRGNIHCVSPSRWYSRCGSSRSEGQSSLTNRRRNVLDRLRWSYVDFSSMPLPAQPHLMRGLNTFLQNPLRTQLRGFYRFGQTLDLPALWPRLRWRGDCREKANRSLALCSLLPEARYKRGLTDLARKDWLTRTYFSKQAYVQSFGGTVAGKDQSRSKAHKPVAAPCTGMHVWGQAR